MRSCVPTRRRTGAPSRAAAGAIMALPARPASGPAMLQGSLLVTTARTRTCGASLIDGEAAPTQTLLAFRVTAPSMHNFAFACVFEGGLLVVGDGATRTRCMHLTDDGDAVSTERVAGARRLPPSLAAASNDGVLVLACAGRIVAYAVSEDGLAPRCSIACACPRAPRVVSNGAGRPRRLRGARRPRSSSRRSDDAAASAPAPRGPARAAALAFLSDGCWLTRRGGDARPGAPAVCRRRRRRRGRAARHC